MKKIILTLILTNFLFASSGSESLKLANKFKAQGDFFQAVKYYEFSANEGNPQAQYIIGDIYLHGLYDSRIDALQAKYYFDLSAKQNNKDALLALGKMYFDGNKAAYVKKNYTTALSFFDKCSTLYSDPQAQYYLGMFYYKGLKVKKDVEKAKDLFLKSCDQDYSQSCQILKDKFKIVL